MKIQKSFKFDGYCFVFEGDKSYKRKIFNRNGMILVNFKSNVYRVEWESPVSNAWASKIEFHQSYAEYMKDDSVTPIENEISNEELQQILNKVKAPQLPKALPDKVFHEQFNKIKTCVENDIPVYLVGPAGSGKNHTLEEIAKELDIDFYFTNSVQQEFKVTGFIDAGGKFHETEFYKAFTNGGLFFLDEMDASIPEVLVLLNAAIANKYFEFPTGKVTAHENFRVVAAGNTFGNGADEQYTGRLVLDQATLDRFVVIDFDYDKNVELWIAKNNVELVDFIRDLREQSKNIGIRATYSYRCITQVTKLEGKMELHEIINMAVFKGLDKDTLKQYQTKASNKYSSALYKMQKAQ